MEQIFAPESGPCAAFVRRSGKDVLCHRGEEDQGGGGGRHPGLDSGVAEIRGAYAEVVVALAAIDSIAMR